VRSAPWGALTAVKLTAVSAAAGVPSRDAARLVLAHTMAATTTLDPRVWFALLAETSAPVTPDGEAASTLAALADAQVDHILEQTLRQPREQVRAALQAAVESNLITDVDVDAAVEQLHTLRLDHIAARPFPLTVALATSDDDACCAPPATPVVTGVDGHPDTELVRAANRPLHVHATPFRAILATSIADPASQRAVLEAFAAHDGNATLATVVDAAAGLSPAQRAHLRFTLEASALLGHHLPLVQHVQQLRATQAITGIRDLARFDEADWAKLLRETDPTVGQLALPAGAARIGGDPIEQFARLLARRFEERYPTAALAGRLAKDRGELPLEATQGVQRFLDGAPAFCVRHTHIDRFVKDMGTNARAASEDKAQVVSDLKTLQRAYKLTPRFAHVQAMLVAGHNSAYAIYATGPTAFSATMTAAGATPDEATALFNQAEQVYATTLTLLANFNSAFNSATPAAVAPPIASAELQAALVSFPSLQSLFGSTDYCACEECRAIHGPAAYLTDILEFLKHRPATGMPNAREVLFARRPDLAQIELSCANTNGVVPYIDLVCEILEDAVVAPAAGVVRGRQTAGTDEERRANPAFVNNAAYTTLKDAVFPHAMPFDLFTAEVRAFLRQLGVPWHDLLSAFQIPAQGTGDPSPTRTRIAAERFGFSAKALELVTTASPAAPWTHFGLLQNNTNVPDPRKPDDPASAKSGTWLQILGYVPILLDRTRLEHRELIQLLATRYINPSGAIKIEMEGTDGFASCDTGKQTVKTWTAEALSRFSRFVRLWRQLRCPIWDLDKVLTTPAVAGATPIDATTIRQLGWSDAIATRLQLPWDEILTLWSDLDRFNYLNVLDTTEVVVPSVYARRFRNATVAQVSTTLFPADPTTLTGSLDHPDVLASIVAALDLSSADLLRIRAAALSGPSGALLNHANLSTLARHAFLAAALDLSIADLVTTIAVTGVDPFTSPTTTLEFLTALEQMRASGFTLLELHYLLRHGSVIDAGIAVTDATIAGWLDDIRKHLARLDGAPDAVRADQVVQRISALLPLDPTLTQAALEVTLPGSGSPMAALFTAAALTHRDPDGSFTLPTTRTHFGAIFDAFTALDKMRLVLGRWRVNNADALWLLQHAAGAGWMQLHTLPVSTTAAQNSPVTLAQLDVLRRNLVVQQTLASPAGGRLFDIVLQPGSPTDAATSIAALGGWSVADLTALATQFGWTTGASFVAGATVPRISDLMAWPRKLGTDVPTTLTFVTPASATNPDNAALAQTARRLTKAKYTNTEWLGIAGAIQDRLREHKRAALVAWLLAHPDRSRGQVWVTLEDLYGFYLIDPEIAPSVTTTRIKQAVSSVQLFVQRSILQLESAVKVDADADVAWTQWDWMKQFRLWEANRKIFLYPENWFDPSQRRDKSPYFVALEGALQQTDLTNDVAEDVLRDYLHKLADVSHLEVSGIFEERLVGTTQTVLHVVARTRKMPYVYSYRRREATGTWSPWEPLDPEIQANHIMPAIWNKRLYMLWTEFTQKPLPTSKEDRKVPSPPQPNENVYVSDVQKYWEITLAWIEQRGGVWLPKRQSQRKQLFPNEPPQGLLFRTALEQRNLSVELYQPEVFDAASSPTQAQWRLTSPQDEPGLMLQEPKRAVVKQIDDVRYIAALIGGANRVGNRPPKHGDPVNGNPRSNDITLHFNAYGGDNPGKTGILKMVKVDNQGGANYQLMLTQVEQPRVISARFGEQLQFQGPFFISDPHRTFFGLDEKWTLQPFYHPFVETFVQQLNVGGIAGLYARTLQTDPDSARGTAPFNESAFAAAYFPGGGSLVTRPYPTETIDYSPSGPYAVYNWEIFLHIPLLIAKRLADNQRFADALAWFHYIFNPTTVSGGTAPQRYWNPRVFRDLTAPDYMAQQIERLLQLVSQHDPALEQQVANWRYKPFDPNLIASTRPVAYQKAVVMQYISTLIAWGDQLFRGDTIESINEATQLYLLASQLLGPRPQNLRALQPPQNKTYNELASQLDTFSNAVVDIENVVSVLPPGVSPGTGPLPQLHTFYFCIPPNYQLLRYWDTVADRLFKVRHGLNLAGVARPLPLFEPPIDPGLLVRAAAAGIDIASVLPDPNAELGCYRFTILWQAAHDLCQDVRSLGSAILAALERRDGEEMARLRATQETAVLDAVRVVKDNQVADAKAQKQALQSGRDMAIERREYYGNRDYMNDWEKTGVALGTAALVTEAVALLLDLFSSGAHLVPEASAGAEGFGGSPRLTVSVSGKQVADSTSKAAIALKTTATILNQGAHLANTMGSYRRRDDEWDFQHRVAEKEVAQLDAQLIAADLRIAIAKQELTVHDQQIADATANEELLKTKFTNKDLYDWMLSQLSSTYFQAYQLAYDLAKRASRAYGFELATPDPGFIQFGYWDSLHKGLVAGDKLLLDLRRLQAEHLHRHTRELELTKHISLLQLDPAALVRLRQTGTCFINLPEEMFDGDQPGHYLRRLKTVSVTLPCVTGPYTTINATLTLASHTTRITTELKTTSPAYRPTLDADGIPATSDTRFSRGNGAVQSVAISTGREDAGLFEVNFHDDRYLPFEGLGAVGHWRLDLPKDTNRFDFATLSDVILHVRYTARDGGDAFRTAVRTEVVSPLPRHGVQLLSARTAFPDAWARLFAPTGAGQSLQLALDARHFLFIPSNQQITITPEVTAFLLFTDEQTYTAYGALGADARLTVRLGFTPADGAPPATAATFTANSDFGGVPTATAPVSGPIGALSLAVLEEDLDKTPLLAQQQPGPDGTPHSRLRGDLIDDVLLYITYQISARS
jgi:hypothetical protein